MRVGLVGRAGGFLTAAGSGSGVSALGSALGPRQTWELKLSGRRGDGAVVELVGPGGQPLWADAHGAAHCARPHSPEQRHFVLEAQPSGAWAFRQAGSGRYLESDGEDVVCVARSCAPAGLWMPRLAGHPHAVLFSPRRQRYARADPELGRVWVDTPAPHVEECGFVLRLWGGAYHLETSGHWFVSRSAKLAAKPSAETAFHLTLKPGSLAFLTDREGHILYPHGPRGLLCLGDSPADNEEWFVIGTFPPWVSLRTRTRRYLTVVGDSDVYAGPKKVTPMSTFHFEVNPDSKTVQLKGINCSYLAQRECKSVVANGCCREPGASFHVRWHYGRIFLRAFSGRYLGTLPVGRVAARAVHPGPSEEFGLRLANRSFLLLRGRYGYVGNAPGHEALQCNLLEPDCIELLPYKWGIYHLKSKGGAVPPGRFPSS